jgi:hypothetical protein
LHTGVPWRVCSICNSGVSIVLAIVTGMPNADDDDRLNRIRQLCSAVDDVHEQAQRVFREVEDSRSTNLPTWPDVPAGPAPPENTRPASANAMPVEGDSER